MFSFSSSQGLEICGPHRRFAPLLLRTLRRIPQAVSTIAIFHTVKYQNPDIIVSIPQAVGTIAIFEEIQKNDITVLVLFQYRKR